MSDRLPSDKARGYFDKLVEGKELWPEGHAWRISLGHLLIDLDDEHFTGRRGKPDRAKRVSLAIDAMKELPWKPRGTGGGSGAAKEEGELAQPGVYVRDAAWDENGRRFEPDGHGHVYIVKLSRRKPEDAEDAPRRVYAVELVEIRDTQGDRLSETGEKIRFENEYRKGLVWHLREEDRMPAADALALTLRTGRCIQCWHPLRLKESLERTDPISGLPSAMGRVCYDRVAGRAARIAVAA